MKLNKLVEATKTVALENLVPPEIAVVTRDRLGEINVWWLQSKGMRLDQLKSRVWNDLYLKSGRWTCQLEGVRKEYLGVDIINNVPICRTYNDLKLRLDDGETGDECFDFKNSEFVSGLLKRISETNPLGVKAPVADKYQIETIYRVADQDFTNMVEAEKFSKLNKLFARIQLVDPQADFFHYEDVIKAMVNDPDSFVDILKGNK